MLTFFLALLLMSTLSMVWCEKNGISGDEQNDIGCQNRFTLGRDYTGTANTTDTGIPCQKWSDTQPHGHPFTHVGNHSFCRNPVGANLNQLWCLTTNPKIQAQYCSVPICPKSKREREIGCQHRSTKGQDYQGMANTTETRLPCQKWSDTKPHDHKFTYVGDHNHCRNPNGALRPWCYTTDPPKKSQFCTVPYCSPLKVLDFSLDNDWKRDANGSFSLAYLHMDDFPSSFTICTAFMVDSWGKSIAFSTPLFKLVDSKQTTWLFVSTQSIVGKRHAQFLVSFAKGSLYIVEAPSQFFRGQWTRVCFSVNSNTSTAALAVDGIQIGEQMIDTGGNPSNLHMILGWGNGYQETPGKFTNVNIFSTPLSNMKEVTEAGTMHCGLSGDYLNWEEADWTLYSKARIIGMDSARGPCRSDSRMHVYPMSEKHRHSDCMQHCEKLGGRSPSVKTFEEWQKFVEEVQHIQVSPLRLPETLWLSATEGDKNMNLSRLDHWPGGIEAVEGVWRDYYTGEKLYNYTKTWLGGIDNGPSHNCINYYTSSLAMAGWLESLCEQPGCQDTSQDARSPTCQDTGCPCIYETKPILRLRGFCPGTHLEHQSVYVPMQVKTNPTIIILLGLYHSGIVYNPLVKKWMITNTYRNVEARTDASQISYALGKQKWTITNDTDECSKKQSSYTVEMKLSGCKEDQFTCDDGQCVKMKQRCNQLPNCRDKSDELGCEILILDQGYNKRIPPITPASAVDDSVRPVPVKISLTLYKVVSMKEDDHSIELQFHITLEWKENRATYHNLKKESYLNALSSDDIGRLWLPLVVYTNTDQQETTRLGVDWEWSTSVLVKREGPFERSGYEVLDEIEIFKGNENSLSMVQSYTHEFQCVYQLESYPFDSQVETNTFKLRLVVSGVLG